MLSPRIVPVREPGSQPVYGPTRRRGDRHNSYVPIWWHPAIDGVNVSVGVEAVAKTAANRAEFRRVFDEHYKAISRYCHRRLAASDANDAAANVFVVAWRRIEEMPTGEGALPWLYGVARNEVSTMRRSVRRRFNLRTKLGSQAQHPEPGPEVVIVRNDEQRHVLAALDRLSVDDQEILRLRAYEHLTIPEVAAVLGISVDAAKKRSTRAIDRLRNAAGLRRPQDVATETRAIEEGGDG